MALIPWLVKQFGNEPTREQKLQGLLANVGQEPQIGAGGMDPQAYVSNPQMAPNSPVAQAQMYGGMLDAGYNAQEAGSMMGMLSPQQAKPTTLAQNLMTAGVDLNTPQGQQTMLDIMRKPQTQINMGSGAGTIWSPEKVAQAGLAPGTVVTNDRYNKPQILNKEKYTQPQILSGTYAARMDDATRSIDEIMATGNFDPAGFKQNIDLFGAPEMLANYVRSPEGQIYRQAQENWISANLRKESGAAIPEEEMEREIKKWFPQPGDDPKTIAKKNAARKTAARGMQKAAGGSYQELIDQGDKDRLNELRQKYAP